jgi:putrescine aminotransferase
VEFTTAHLAAEVISEMLARRVLTACTPDSHEVIRLTPPASMTTQELDWLTSAFSASCQAVSARLRERSDQSAGVPLERRALSNPNR